MFTHINVAGAMSGALTTGDKLTGGTSGATGIIESVSTAGSATITGATRADPVVVQCQVDITLLKVKILQSQMLLGMTDINGTHTVKNATATTFELFEVATASNTHLNLLMVQDLVLGHLAVLLYTQLLF